MPTQQHTPTPWEGPFSQNNPAWRGVHKRGLPICTAWNGPNGEEFAEPNAAFIVRACNAHEALVAALEKAYDAFSEAVDNDNALVDHPALAEIESALKLARGES